MADRPDPTVLVLFGATGDLARRKVLPALFSLARAGLLPQDWRLVASSRRDGDDEQLRRAVHEALTEFGPAPEEGPWEEFSSRLHFAGGGFSADDPGALVDVLTQAEQELGGSPQRVFYLATPPVGFEGYTAAIGAHGLAQRSRVVYEKPFGWSQDSFRSLDAAAHEVLDESQIFRIDHFLGKEATQDLHVVRFANGLFSRSWDREHIASVQVDVPETLDVADRAEFYDATGAVLDMLVTHLFQVAAEVAMEQPTSFDADGVARAREEVIGAFRPLTADDVVLGQYEGFLGTEGVAEGSTTDTFVAARLFVDTDRWRGVPFLLRTGKRMATSAQRVSVVFREAETTLGQDAPGPDVLSFELSGDGSIRLRLVAKRPGTDFRLGAVTAELPLGSSFDTPVLDAYARLLSDVLTGDRTLFTRPDGLAHVWEVAAPLLDGRPDPLPYAAGSWGPAAADRLVGPAGWVLQVETEG